MEAAETRVWHGCYPEGPQNAEGVLVHPASGRIYVVTKDESGACGLYAFPREWKADECLVLEKIAPLQFPAVNHPGKRPGDNCMTTGADFSPDGTRLVISTYCSLYEWRLPADGPTPEALSEMPVRLLPPLTRQMEAVCYGADSRTLSFTSEHLPTPLWRLGRR